MIPQLVEVTEEEHELRLKKFQDSCDIIKLLEKRIKRCNDRLYLFNQAEKYFGDRQEETFRPEIDPEQEEIISSYDKREGSVFMLQDQMKSMNFKFTLPKKLKGDLKPRQSDLAIYTPKKRVNITTKGHSNIVNRLNFHLKNIKKYEPKNFERLKQTMNISPSKAKQKQISDKQATKNTKVFEKLVDDENHLMQKLEEYTEKDMQKEIGELFGQIREKVVEVTMGVALLQTRVKDVENIKSQINLGTHDRIFKTVATLAAGDHFGELALMNKKGTRTARIAADKRTVLGVLSRDVYNRVLIKIEKQRKDSLCEFVKEMPFFKSLTKAASAKIVNSLNY